MGEFHCTSCNIKFSSDNKLNDHLENFHEEDSNEGKALKDGAEKLWKDGKYLDELEKGRLFRR